MRALVLAIVLSTAAWPALAERLTLTCRPTEKYVCQMGAACGGTSLGGSAPITAWTVIDVDMTTPEVASYSRCDMSGCDTYPARASVSGQTMVFEIPGKGAFSKVMPNLVWTEVASQTTLVVSSFGYCATN